MEAAESIAAMLRAAACEGVVSISVPFQTEGTVKIGSDGFSFETMNRLWVLKWNHQIH